jgi:hypothetical protein
MQNAISFINATYLKAAFFFVVLMSCISTTAQSVNIENADYVVVVNATTGGYNVVSKHTEKAFLKDGVFGDAGGKVNIVKTFDQNYGYGQSIEVEHANGNREVITLFSGLPFIEFRSFIHNGSSAPVVLNHVAGVSASVDLGRPASELHTLGTGGLLKPKNNPGSYAFLAIVDSSTRSGVVGGWLTQDRSSGVVFSPVQKETVVIKSRMDYGRLRIKPASDVETETFLLGYFHDARQGLEAYADAVAKQYAVTIRPKQPGLCTWYMEKNKGACDENKLVDLTSYAASKLGPYGFGFVQIDDGWQSGISYKKKGPKRDFTDYNPSGPYPHGMKVIADRISQFNLMPGIWFMPFAASSFDSFFTKHENWFVQTRDGKPYETEWGGTCLDLTRPETRDYVRSVITRIGHDWGYKLFKLDGFWTGSATKQIYVNEGYKEDGIGDAVFFNPDKSNIEALRDGAKLVREAAGPDVFLLGCCLPQNMRSFSGSLGLVDAMRVGPDTGSGVIGHSMASRLWFLNGRVWWNDPDCVSVRASITLDQARLNASFAAIAGTLFYNSDWMPDLPNDRLDILRRCMPGHDLLARPVDIFENDSARIWHLLDTRSNVRRDVIALFNYEAAETTIDSKVSELELPEAPEYVGFDFWENKFLPPFKNTMKAKLPPHSCRVIAIRPAANHPQLISTSRHITQGMVDVTDETWDAKTNTLSGISRVVGKDLYELRIVLPQSNQTWHIAQINLSPEDKAAGIKTDFKQDDLYVRATLSSPSSRLVRWKVVFSFNSDSSNTK